MPLDRTNSLSVKAIICGVLTYLGMQCVPFFLIPALGLLWPGIMHDFFHVLAGGARLYIFFSSFIAGYVTGWMAKKQGFIHGLIVGTAGMLIINVGLNFLFPSPSFRFYVETILISGVVCGISSTAAIVFRRNKERGK